MARLTGRGHGDGEAGADMDRVQGGHLGQMQGCPRPQDTFRIFYIFSVTQMIDNGFKSPFPPFNSLFVTLCECLIVIIIKLDSLQGRALLEKVAGPRADSGGKGQPRLPWTQPLPSLPRPGGRIRHQRALQGPASGLEIRGGLRWVWLSVLPAGISLCIKPQ